MSDAEYAADARATHLAALRAEQEGYERRGLTERAEQVAQQIAKFAPEQAEQAPKRTTARRA